MATIRTELVAATKVRSKAGEPEEDFAARLLNKANDLSESVWAGLSPEAQLWVNTAVDAKESANPLPALPPAETGDEPPVKAAKAAKAPKVAKVKAEKAPKAEKPAKAAKAPNVKAPRGKGGTPDDAARIKLAVKANPHRVTSKDFGKFAKLSSGMTVGTAIAAGVDRGYIRYAIERAILTVASKEPKADKAPAPAAPEPAAETVA